MTYKPTTTTATTKRLSDFSSVIFLPGKKKWSYRFEIFKVRKGELKILFLAKMTCICKEHRQNIINLQENS